MSSSKAQDTTAHALLEHRPQDYFSRRLALAREVLLDGNGLFRRVLSASDQTMSPETSADELGEQGYLNEAGKYIAVDLEMLKFHSIETLLRYFNGYLSAPDRSWQKISGLEDRSAFGRDLKTLWEVDLELRTKMIARAFFGVTDDDSVPSELAADWQERLEGIEAFMSHYVSYFADIEGLGKRHREREKYNAAKHGMTLVPVPMTELDEASVTGLVGLAYLEYEGQSGSEKWKLKVAWTNSEALMLEIFYAIMLLEQIWQVGTGEVGRLPELDDWKGVIDWSLERFSHLDTLLEQGSGELVWDLEVEVE